MRSRFAIGRTFAVDKSPSTSFQLGKSLNDDGDSVIDGEDETSADDNVECTFRKNVALAAERAFGSVSPR